MRIGTTNPAIWVPIKIPTAVEDLDANEKPASASTH
jgi:hypothetical protein